MIRASLFALSLLIAAPVMAAPESDGHNHETPEYVLSEAPSDHVIGNADADHTLIIYASNMCGHCKNWFDNEWDIVKTDLIETGKLKVVFRPFVTSPPQLSYNLFQIAECSAPENYMRVIEDQFDRQPKILDAVRSIDAIQQTTAFKKRYEAQRAGLPVPANDPEYQKMDAIFVAQRNIIDREIQENAKIAGLHSSEMFGACIQDQKNVEHIVTSGARASAAKIDSAPSFIFDGMAMTRVNKGRAPGDAAAIKGWVEGRSSIR